jgi:tetratricopeptide (TPR) repeat protein
VLACAPLVAGCTGSSDPASDWERDHAKGLEARQAGRYAEAESRLVAALKAAERFKPDDPRLLTTLTDLIDLYDAQGKHSEIEPLLRRVLTVTEQTQGQSHPQAAGVLHKLAKLNHRLGEYGEAESFYRRALAIDDKALGPTHPDTLVLVHEYAALLRETNRADEADTFLAARAKTNKGTAPLPICPD